MITRRSLRNRLAARRQPMRMPPTPEESGVWVEENWSELVEELNDALETFNEYANEIITNNEGWEKTDYVEELATWALKYLGTLQKLLMRVKGAYSMHARRIRSRR